MSQNFDRAFTDLLGHEGGYNNNPADPGGETNWGITAATARANGYVGAMKTMDQSVAKTIYARQFWLPEFDQLPYPIAFQLFDAAVNSGVGQAVRWLQRAVGVADDGHIGPVTVAAVTKVNSAKAIALFNAERLVFMTDLSAWPNFGRGWARRIASNIKKGVQA